MTEISERTAPADQFQILATHGRQLKAFAAGYGIDLEPIARSLHLDLEMFEDFAARISFDRFCRLLETLAALSGDPSFGLKYGEQFRHGATGPYGYGLLNAPTFKDALHFIIKYTPNQVDFDNLSLTNRGDKVVVDWSYSPLVMQNDQFLDFTSVVILRQFRSCAGPSFRLLDAQLTRRLPTEKAPYMDWFCSHVRFGARSNQVVLPHDLLSLENPKADKVLFDYMSAQCQQTAQSLKRTKNILTVLKEDFIRHLGDQDVSLAVVAKRNGMSERTLQRRLEAMGTTFQEVYESTRDEMSMHCLVDTDMSLSEISHLLGYSAQSAYTRFVKRRHGKSPGQLRTEAVSRHA